MKFDKVTNPGGGFIEIKNEMYVRVSDKGVAVYWFGSRVNSYSHH